MEPIGSTDRLEDASLAIYNNLGKAEVLNVSRWLVKVQERIISRLSPLFAIIVGANYDFDRTVVGSIGEGISDQIFLNEQKGDIDVLYIIKNATVLMKPETVHDNNKWVFQSEPCAYNAGYVKLKVIQRGFGLKFTEFIQTFCELTNDNNSEYLLNTLHVPSMNEPEISSKNEYHHIESVVLKVLFSHFDINGPAFSWNYVPAFMGDKIDFVIGISSSQWPAVAKAWIERRRPYGWPSQTFISQQVLRGCHVVPVGCKKCENNLDWRLSFSHVEQALVHSLNSTQFLCFFLLRQLKKSFFETRLGDKITSYIIKTTLFWTIEKTASSQWCPNRLLDVVQRCLDTLINFIQNDFCPSYFISDCNLLEGKYAVTDKPFVLKCCKHARRNTLELLSKTRILENVSNVFPMGYLAMKGANNVDIRNLSDTELETFMFPMVPSIINKSVSSLLKIPLGYKHSISEAIAHCKQAFKKLRSMESSFLVSCVQCMLRNHIVNMTWSERLLNLQTNKSKFSCIRALRYEFDLMADLSGKVVVCHLLVAVEQYALCNEKLKAVISNKKKIKTIPNCFSICEKPDRWEFYWL